MPQIDNFHQLALLTFQISDFPLLNLHFLTLSTTLYVVHIHLHYVLSLISWHILAATLCVGCATHTSCDHFRLLFSEWNRNYMYLGRYITWISAICFLKHAESQIIWFTAGFNFDEVVLFVARRDHQYKTYVARHCLATYVLCQPSCPASLSINDIMHMRKLKWYIFFHSNNRSN